MPPRTINKRRIHAMPCIQSDNVEHLKQDVQDIKSNVLKVTESIKGNGKDGIEKNLTILTNHMTQLTADVDSIKNQFKVVNDINREIEIQSRCKQAADAAAAAIRQEFEAKQQLLQEVEIKRGSFSLQRVATIVAVLSLMVAATFSVLNYKTNKAKQSTQLVRTTP